MIEIVVEPRPSRWGSSGLLNQDQVNITNGDRNFINTDVTESKESDISPNSDKRIDKREF